MKSLKLDNLRKEINQIDTQILALFEKRMHIASQIGAYKKAHDLPVLDQSREDALLRMMLEKVNDPELKPYYEKFLQHLMDLSKAYQHEV